VDAEAEVDRLHQQLGVEREVERVAQERHLEQQLARERPVARVHLGEVRAEREVLRGGQAAVGDHLPPRHPARSRPARGEEARAEDEVGVARHDRLDELGDDPGLVLAVGVQHDHHVGVALQRLEVARLLVAPVAHVVRVPEDVEVLGQPARDLDRVVGGLVVDEDDLVDPAVGDARHRPLQGAGGVAGGHDDDDLGACVLGHGAAG
jgi:hypothetical protein